MQYCSLFVSLLALSSVSAQAVGGVVGVTSVDSYATPTIAGTDATSTPSVSAAATASTAAPLTGDSTCVTSMCISAVLNSTTATYTLQSRNGVPGWMAMGFGTKMANAAMVIMWPNSDGTVTLSQRSAPTEQEPTVAADPPRVATLVQSLSVSNSSGASFVFTVPVNSDTNENIIYAFSGTNPNDASVSANLVQHDDYGTASLDLTKPLSTGNSTSASTADLLPPSSASTFIPYQPYEKMIIAHAIFSTIGFLFLLPIGVFVARYLRLTGIKWFKGHWILQFVFGGAMIGIGFFLGVAAVVSHQVGHFNDPHKKLGLVIIILYILQCSLGAFIHFIKIGWATGRPPQNYIHAVLGLTIIGMALFQVHSGLQTEWVTATGRPPIGNSLKVLLIIWAVLLPAMYIAGLPLVPKQYKQERIARLQNADKEEATLRGPSPTSTDMMHSKYHNGGQYV